MFMLIAPKTLENYNNNNYHLKKLYSISLFYFALPKTEVRVIPDFKLCINTLNQFWLKK